MGPLARLIASLGAGLGLVSSCLAIARLPNLAEAPRAFLILSGIAFACYSLGAWCLGGLSGRGPLLVTLLVAAASRAALAPAAPTLSTDAYRYVWDARVARARIDPYAYPPDAPELVHLRDQVIYPRLNHPSWRTIYPPGAQVFFRLVYGLEPDSVLAMKTALGLLELAALGALYALLRQLGVPVSRAVIYAWNPLVLIETWGSAHLDAAVLPVVVVAACVAARGRRALAASLLGAGTLVKVYPAALVPLLLGPGSLPAVGLFTAVVTAGYLLRAVPGLEVVGSLPRYLVEESFNPGLVRSVTGTPWASAAALALWVLGVSAWRRSAPLAERALPLIGGSLLLAPSIFPWYVVWLVPFLAVVPSVPWIAFTGTVMLAYTFFLGSPWAIPGWARLLEFAPLVIGAAWALAGRRRLAALREQRLRPSCRGR